MCSQETASKQYVTEKMEGNNAFILKHFYIKVTEVAEFIELTKKLLQMSVHKKVSIKPCVKCRKYTKHSCSISWVCFEKTKGSFKNYTKSD